MFPFSFYTVLLAVMSAIKFVKGCFDLSCSLRKCEAASYFYIIRTNQMHFFFLSAWFVIPYCILIQFFFAVLIFVCLFFLLGIDKFDIIWIMHCDIYA